MLPREAVPVGSGQAGCRLEALRLSSGSWIPYTYSQYTHTETEQWAQHGVRTTPATVTQLSHSCHGAWAELEAHLHWLGTGDIAERHKQQLFDAWKERKKQLYFHLKLSQKQSVMVFFGIVHVVEQMHFTYPKCSGLYVEVPRRQTPWGCKMDATPPAQQKTVHFLTSWKKSCPTKEQLFPGCRKPSEHK